MAQKNSFWRSLLITAGTFATLNVVGSALIARKNRLKMDEHPNDFNIMHTVTMGRNVVEVSENISHAYFSCLTGAMDINFVTRNNAKEVFVDLSAICSKINIYLPENAVLEWDGDDMFTTINDTREVDEEPENAFIVHLKRLALCTTINIGTVVEE